jgi:hypothetical protein
MAKTELIKVASEALFRELTPIDFQQAVCFQWNWERAIEIRPNADHLATQPVVLTGG